MELQPPGGSFSQSFFFTYPSDNQEASLLRLGFLTSLLLLLPQIFKIPGSVRVPFLKEFVKIIPILPLLPVGYNPLLNLSQSLIKAHRLRYAKSLKDAGNGLFVADYFPLTGLFQVKLLSSSFSPLIHNRVSKSLSIPFLSFLKLV